MEIAPIAVIVVARAFLRQPQALVNKPGQLAMLFRSHADVHRPPPRPWPSDECGCCEPKVIDDRLAAHLGDDGALFGRDHVLRCYLPMLPGSITSVRKRPWWRMGLGIAGLHHRQAGRDPLAPKVPVSVIYADHSR